MEESKKSHAKKTAGRKKPVSKGNDLNGIAIIGMSGRFPGANTATELWENLINQVDPISEIPGERWNWEDYLDDSRTAKNKTQSKWGGFLKNIDQFDAPFFRISPKEAVLMDPQQRLVMEETWRAIEDAGYKQSDLSDVRTGVFMGVCNDDHKTLLMEHEELSVHASTGGDFSVISNRISHFFNFNGPSIALDTACSSSLIALHQAVTAIEGGECDMAISGGVNLCLTPKRYCTLSPFLSPDGRCKTFDQSGNGYVRSEGVAVLLLKPLKKAVADHDHIYGVIKGSATNHDGRTNFLTTPNPDAHARLLCSAYEKANIDPETISYIETHGTGTRVGDPIEINGLEKTFRQLYEKWGHAEIRKQHCKLGSVKSNIGHLEAAAGIAGVFKVLLAMKHRMLPGNLHLRKLNAYIRLNDTPFSIVAENQPWEVLTDDSGNAVPRRAGVSSFGYGGANAHVVLEEYEPKKQPFTETSEPHLFLLSARDESLLKASAQQLIDFMEIRPETRLHDLAYTLQIGREAMPVRLAWVAHDKDELKEKLTQYIRENKTGKGFYFGKRKGGKSNSRSSGETDEKTFVTDALRKKDRDRLAEAWIGGEKIDWQLLYPKQKPQRIPLPTYPFAGKRYRIPAAEEKNAASDKGSNLYRAGKLHPLIGTNRSTLSEQQFTTALTGEEFYLTDHVVADTKTLPGVAFLEMARAAGELAAEQPVLKISNVVWAIPVTGSDTPVRIGLHPTGSQQVGFEISTSPKGSAQKVHAQGKLWFGDQQNEQADTMNIAAIKKRCNGRWDKEKCYQLFRHNGLCYGETFQTIQTLHYGEAEALSVLQLPPSLTDHFDSFVLHPSVMDGALQTVIGLEQSNSSDPSLPFALKSAEIFGTLSERSYAYVRRISNADAAVRKFNIAILDEEGTEKVRLSDLAIRTLKKERPETIWCENVWEASATNEPTAGMTASSGFTLLFDMENSRHASFKEKFGGAVVLIQPGKAYRKTNANTYFIHPEKPEDYKKLLADLKAHHDQLPGHIIHLWSQNPLGEEETALNTRLNEGLYSIFHLSQALFEQKRSKPVQVLYLYQVAGGVQPPYAAISAFTRSIHLESAKLHYKTIALSNPEEAATVAFKEAQMNDGVEVKYHDGERFVKRLREFKATRQAPGPTGLKEQGVYLITGGAGGLGLVFAEYLAKHFKAKLVLAGRSELSPEKARAIEKLHSYGAEAVYRQVDIAKADEVKHLISVTKKEQGVINGIIHAAGTTQDAFFFGKKAEEIKTVLAPKVFGTLWLDEFTKQEPLDFIVFFSSIASSFGNAGQCDYAYANAFMDQFAERREALRTHKKRTGKTISISWPLWKTGGMQVDEATQKMLTHTMGMQAISNDRGWEIFTQALEGNKSHFVVIDGNYAKLKKWTGLENKPTKPATPPSARPETGRFAEKFLSDLLQMAGDILKIDAEDIDPEAEINEHGFDSIDFTQLANKINERFGLELTPTIFFEHPSLSDFSGSLCHHHPARLSNYYSGAEACEAPATSLQKPQNEAIKDQAAQKFLRDLLQMAGDILKIEAEEIDPEAEISEHGFDSIDFTQLANKINERFGLELTPTVFFEHASLSEFAEFSGAEYQAQIVQHYGNGPTGKPATPGINPGIAPSVDPSKETAIKSRFMPQATTQKGTDRQKESINELQNSSISQNRSHADIAIIGMSGIMPQSKDLDRFWEHLVAGDDLISEVPADRWDWKAYYGDAKQEKNKTKAKWGGFVPDVDKFDPQFFGISPREAELMDPQQRLILETVWKTIEDAGYPASDLSGTKTGVFIGVTTHDYDELIKEHTHEIEAFNSTGWAHSITANRISYLLNLRGPSEPVDTACSSSLIAIHRAVEAIRSGACETAIAGGVNVTLTPFLTLSFSKAGMLSEDGRCKTFDEKADGYVRGEGVGAIWLKPLEKAEQDGDMIHAVIKSTAENHGGRASSLTAPNPNAQAELLVEAYQKAGFDPDTIGYIEAHGTGTSLGDPIEINGLKRAFKQMYERAGKPLPSQPHCGIGAVKTHIGHLESAAGIASTLKVLLAMRHKMLPGNLHFEKQNPYIQLEGSPFYIVNQNQEWKTVTDHSGNELPRRAGVSSFGFGGANAHIVLEEYQRPNAAYRSHSSNQIVVLSAQNENRLKAYAKRILDFMGRNPEVKPDELAYTLQTGREPMPERLALVVKSKDELKEKLTEYTKGNRQMDEAYFGNAKQYKNASKVLIEGEAGKAFMKVVTDNKELSKIAQLWTMGVAIDWALLHAEPQPRRIALPSYPFARQRHWINISTPKTAGLAFGTEATAIHKTNASTRKTTHTNGHEKTDRHGSDKDQTSVFRNTGQNAGPANREEQPLKKLRSDLLDISATILKANPEDLDILEELTAYGFNSINFVELANAINKKYGSEIAPSAFFDCPTIDALSRFLWEAYKNSIVDVLQEPVAAQTNTMHRKPDKASELKAEAVLSDDIHPSGLVFNGLPAFPNILLTGATGFLGAFLIDELLKQTTGHIHCLVRDKDENTAQKRLYSNLKKYGVWQKDHQKRLTVLTGDLSRPRLGLKDDAFERLAQQMDVIYHNGAHLNYIYPYKGLRAINVNSTKDILRLATTDKLKPVHYISSIVVVTSAHYAGKTLREDDPIHRVEGMELAYAQSKWVAEQLVLEAGKRGLPTTIYRPPYISGHSRTGAWNTNDFICRLFKAAIQTGYIYEVDSEFDLSPVDYVSKAIVYLSTQPEHHGKTFHLTNPQPWDWNRMVQWLRQYGYSVEAIPYAEWLDKIKPTQQKPEDPLHHLLPFFSARYGEKQLTIPELYTKPRLPYVDSKATRNALARGGITCPPVEERLMETYFDVWIKKGFIIKPQKSISHA